MKPQCAFSSVPAVPLVLHSGALSDPQGNCQNELRGQSSHAAGTDNFYCMYITQLLH